MSPRAKAYPEPACSKSPLGLSLSKTSLSLRLRSKRRKGGLRQAQPERLCEGAIPSKLSATLALALVLACAPTPAHAACTVTAVAVAFGTYTPTNTGPRNGTGSVTVNCSPNDNFSIALGTGGGGDFANRRMTSGGFTLDYQLYTNSARTIVWGDGTAGTSVRAFSSRASATATVYGRIPALQNVGAGVYGDSVVVTVTY